MPSDALPAERLRRYLGELNPETRTLLIAELERSLLRGDDMPGADLVLHELRRALRVTGHGAARTDDAARAFFLPLEIFVVDDVPLHEHPGRIPRSALMSLWSWISRDVLPAETQSYSDEVSRALIEGDHAKVEAMTRVMHDQVARAMDEIFAKAEADDKVRRRLASQIPVAHGVDTAKEILTLLKSRDAMKAFGAQLPGHLNSLGDNQIMHIKGLLDAQLAQKSGIFVHGLVTVMSRLSASWQLIRLATKAAESDKASRVASTPYAAAVTIVLAEVERLVGELKADLKSGRGVAVIALLKVIHDAARGLRTEMDMPMDSAWGRQLAAIRTEISNLLKSEIESTPARIRRLLRPRPAKEIAAGSELDAGDVAEVEALVGFVDACRKYAGELALNEITLRTYSEMQTYLESCSQALLDGLRAAGDGDRRFRQSQLEAAARFGGKVFGSDYAATLTKAAEMALAANRERKAS